MVRLNHQDFIHVHVVDFIESEIIQRIYGNISKLVGKRGIISSHEENMGQLDVVKGLYTEQFVIGSACKVG